MALYQKSVLKKYLKGLDQAIIQAKYEIFKSYFLHPTIQENIRKSKEEEFQATFLNELFVKILGYTLKPQPNYNLVTEYKNVTNSKKADGAILQTGKAIGIIELKGTNTTDLNKVETQAFGYKNNQPHAIYVITSNFEKLRFYIDNAVEYEEFNLFHLSLEQFKILWLCLVKENVFKGLPKQIKDSSLLEEENITKKLYKDYSTFKQQLFESIIKLNPQFDKLLLYKKTQKLLDRFLFIFFSEDGGLLPPNFIKSIIDQWIQLRDELDAYTPLYNRFKKYFGYMNKGHKGKKHDIFAYNGGLFAPDEILDTIKIEDTLLYVHTQKLSAYDFKSEVDVNILGHIFEYSLNEIEEITAQIAGKAVDKRKSKRKKDGVFYTPKYITKYIVENTIGTLCEAKKKELAIDEMDYYKGRKRRKKATLITLKTKLDTYRNWLLNLTICDPACGSGAFLNQALDFLIKEHEYISELNNKLFGSTIPLSDIENAILENNLYGVDINEESVDIAKLSLWLRSAQPNRKLTALNNNIKCGNSLIDDPKVAGDKAFNWQKEFPKVFKNGGFDVVIGNPPYVRSRELFSELEKSYFYKTFQNTSYQLDLYKLFIEKSIELIHPLGKLSFITPSVFMVNDYDKKLRQFLLKKISFKIIANTDEKIFGDASVKTVIFVIDKSLPLNNNIDFQRIKKGQFIHSKNIAQTEFNNPSFIINELIQLNAISIIKKLNKFDKLETHFIVKNGIKVRKDLLFENQIDSNYKPFILGRNLLSYYYSWRNLYIHYLRENEKLYTNQAFRNKEIFEQKKLIVRQILGKKIITCFDNKNIYTDQTTYVINRNNDEKELKNLLCVLNSKLLYFYFQNTFSDNKITFPKVKRSQLLELPIPKFNNSFLFEKANNMIQKNHERYEKVTRFIRRIQSNLSIKKPSKKLQAFYNYDFKTFLSELKKKKVKLSLIQQDEWEAYFEAYKMETNQLQREIDKTDREIDKIVYELYGLTEEEIQIVENA